MWRGEMREIALDSIWIFDARCTPNKQDSNSILESLPRLVIPFTHVCRIIIILQSKNDPIMSFWFRHRRALRAPEEEEREREQQPVATPELLVVPRSRGASASEHSLLTMATNHMIAFVIILYGLYGICRFGFGWDPIRDPPPPNYMTIHIPGVTDHAKPAGRLRGSH